MNDNYRTPLALAIACARLLWACSASAVPYSFDTDPSVISAGMGGASNAVFWSAEPNYWGNPALLGYYRGARWQWSRARLATDFYGDMYFTSRRLTFGVAGIGLAFAGRPFEKVGGLRLDSHQFLGINEDGYVTSAHEDVEMAGCGVSAVGLAAAIANMSGRELPPPLLRYFDVAAGWNEKQGSLSVGSSYHYNLLRSTAHDKGLLARAGLGTDVFGRPGTIIRVDVSYGYSIVGDDGHFANGEGPIPNVRRNGYAVRVSCERPTSSDGHGMVSRLSAVTRRIASLGFAADLDRVQIPTDVTASFGTLEIHRWGTELAILDVLSLRYGNHDDPLFSDVDPYGLIPRHGHTWGVGVAIPLGEVASVRYDFGTLPVGTEFSDLHSHSVSVHLDPFVIAARLKSRRAA